MIPTRPRFRSTEDVTPDEKLTREKRKMVDTGEAECKQYIRDLENGVVKCQPGCSAEETVEGQIKQTLSAV